MSEIKTTDRDYTGGEYWHASCRWCSLLFSGPKNILHCKTCSDLQSIEEPEPMTPEQMIEAWRGLLELHVAVKLERLVSGVVYCAIKGDDSFCYAGHPDPLRAFELAYRKYLEAST